MSRPARELLPPRDERLVTVGLEKYDQMCRAIVACHAVDEVKDLRDKAKALEVYAHQARNLDAERKCCEVRIRAERRAGQLLKEMKASGQRDAGTGGDRKSQSCQSTVIKSVEMPEPPATLGKLGISKDQSSKWQQLADIPEAEFEQAISGERLPTTEGIIEERKPHVPMPTLQIDEDALWFFGWLGEFERRGILNSDVGGLMALMTEAMREECERILPVVRRWLESEATSERHGAA